MKKLLTLLVLGVFVIASCQQENSILDPPEKLVQQSIDGKTWVDLPPRSDLSVETLYSFSNLINGAVGGIVLFSTNFIDTEGNEITIMGSLNVPAGAYSGSEDITVIIDNQTTSVDFTPSPMSFAVPLQLDIKYMKLTTVDPNDNVDFYYLAPSGYLEPVEYMKLKIELEKGKLFCFGAKLPHFSRYGFVN